MNLCELGLDQICHSFFFCSYHTGMSRETTNDSLGRCTVLKWQLNTISQKIIVQVKIYPTDHCRNICEELRSRAYCQSSLFQKIFLDIHFKHIVRSRGKDKATGPVFARFQTPMIVGPFLNDIYEPS